MHGSARGSPHIILLIWNGRGLAVWFKRMHADHHRKQAIEWWLWVAASVGATIWGWAGRDWGGRMTALAIIVCVGTAAFAIWHTVKWYQCR
jgi:hypothetical protein